MSSHHKEDIQVEVQDSEAQVDGDIDIEEGEEITDLVPKQQEKKDKAVDLIRSREPGKSLLPFARVQKIIKADKEIPVVAKEATFLISFATEEFIKTLCQAAHYVAQRDKRQTVHHRDIAAVVRKADEFLFLEEIMPWVCTEGAMRQKPQPSGTTKKPSPTLDQFIGSTGDQTGDEEIVLNADGTMESRV